MIIDVITIIRLFKEHNLVKYNSDSTLYFVMGKIQFLIFKENPQLHCFVSTVTFQFLLDKVCCFDFTHEKLC